MNEQDNAALTKFVTYAEQVMHDSSKESEKSVLMVSRILDIIMSDVSRISKMSEETLKALEEAKQLAELEAQRIREEGGDSTSNEEGPHKSSFGKLNRALALLAKSDVEMQSFVMPIVEALQFQDRVRQQMENTTKMFPSWLQMRKRLEAGEFADVGSEQALVFFGTELMKFTTTNEERDAICSFIPNLQPPSVVASDDDFFF